MKKALFISGILLSGILSAAPLTLSENGKTGYILVPPANATAMEQLALRELQMYLKKQKEGKKRMKQIGRVNIPQDAFIAVLKAKEN